jgi:hypothetical protein
MLLIKDLALNELIFCLILLTVLLIMLYRKQTFLDCYSNLILPSNGHKLWPEVVGDPILPPKMRRAPGRPKKLRRKTNDEPKRPSAAGGMNKRNQETVRCKRCKELGHNQRTCGGKTGADRKLPKGANKV